MKRFRLALAGLCIGGAAPAAAEQISVFGGGCFWCLEAGFAAIAGVLSVETGYAGAGAPPRYDEVANGRTDYRFAVRVIFDERVVSYDKLLIAFWPQIDPTDGGGQFCERGAQFQAVLYPLDAAQAAAAEASRDRIAQRIGRPPETRILPNPRFWPAESAHQDYAAKNPRRYEFYRRACGIDERLSEIWGDRPDPRR